MSKLFALCASLALLLTLAACGAKLEGEYVDDSGLMKVTLSENHKAYVQFTFLELATEYELVEGNRVLIKAAPMNIVLKRGDDGFLSGDLVSGRVVFRKIQKK